MSWSWKHSSSYSCRVCARTAFKNSKGCLYIKRLENVDETILEQLVTRSVEYVRNTYPATP